MFVGSSSLVDMYSKCGSIEDTWKVFWQDVQTQFGLLECQHSGICEVWTREQRHWNDSGKCREKGGGAAHPCLPFVGVFSMYVHDSRLWGWSMLLQGWLVMPATMSCLFPIGRWYYAVGIQHQTCIYCLIHFYWEKTTPKKTEACC